MDAVRGCWMLTRSARVYFVDTFKKGAAVDNMNYFGVIKRSVKSTKSSAAVRGWSMPAGIPVELPERTQRGATWARLLGPAVCNQCNQ